MDKLWCLLTGVLMLILGNYHLDFSAPAPPEPDWMHGTQTAEFRASSAPKLPEDPVYTFYTVDPDEWWELSKETGRNYAFMRPIRKKERQNEGDYALTLGQIWAVFGEPADPEWYEDFFCYYITAEDAEGHVLCFQLYQGAAGPSVCGPIGDEFPEHEAAAEELCTLILSTPPADYTWGADQGYEDYDITMRYACQDGHAAAYF